MEIISIIAKVFPIILMIILGQLFSYKKFIRPETVTDLKKIISNFALPMLLFLTFTETSFDSKYLLVTIIIFVFCCLLMLAGVLIGHFTKSPNRYLPTTFSTFENSMIGYTVIVAIYGTSNLYHIAIFDLGHIIFVSIIFIPWIQLLNAHSVSAALRIKSIIKSPYIWAVISGIVLQKVGLVDLIKSFAPANSVLEAIKVFTGITVPLVCIVIGYELRINLKQLLKPFLAVLLRLTLSLSICVILDQVIFNSIFPMDSMFRIALYTMFLLPPAFISAILIDDKAEKDKQFVLNMITINLILFLILFPIVVIILT